MIDFVKCFTEIQIEDVSVLVSIQITHDVLNMVKELGQAASSSSEAMLILIDDILGFNKINQLSTEDPFEHLDEMRC